MVHNHITRDIRPPGLCPACDEHHDKAMGVHVMTSVQVAPPVKVRCSCGAEFDAFGDKGAISKLNDHIDREAAARLAG